MRWASAAPALAIVLVLGPLAACTADRPEAHTPLADAPVVVASDPPADPAETSPDASATASDRWRPAPGLTWQYQLSGAVDTAVVAQVYDVDAESTPESTLEALRSTGARLVCYFSAGTWEPWRSDATSFPASVQGAAMADWPDERWLDIRQMGTLLPIMDARMAACRAKGFDAVEPDNVDGYANETGFPLTAADQQRYNEALADRAHAHGLSVGLKNATDLVDALEPVFDFAVVEECVRYDECGAYAPFTRAGKAVFHVEYVGDLADICAPHEEYGFSSIRKDLALGADRQSC